jgi:hypothetical protein
MEIIPTSKNKIGGSSKMQVALIDDIDIFPSTKTQTITSNQIIFKEGKSWIDIPVTHGTIKPSIKNKETAAGEYQDTKIEADCSEQSPENTLTFEKLNRRKCIVRIKRLVGNWKLYGTKTNPLRFNYTEHEGQRVKDFSGYKIKTTGKLISKPIYIID